MYLHLFVRRTAIHAWLGFCSAVLGFSATADDLVRRPITFMSVGRTKVAPKIDGDLDDLCWRQTREIGGFQRTAGDRSKPVQFATTARLLFDDTHVYIAFECLEPDVAGLKSSARFHDDPDIEFDDRVEVFLDLAHDHRNYWELAVNPAGAQFDQAAFYRYHGSRTCDFFPEKNLFCRAKTKIGADRWTIEIAIDVTSLGLVRIDEGTTWGFNLARVRRPAVQHGDELRSRLPGEGAEYSAWVPVQDFLLETISNFHAPLEFGDLVFGDPGFVVEELRLRSAKFDFGGVGRPSEFGWNPLEVNVRTADGAPRTLAFEVTVEPENETGWSEQGTREFRSREAQTLRYHVSEDRESKVTLQLLDPASGRPLYRTSYVETVPPFAEFDLAAIYAPTASTDDTLKVRVRADAATRAACELRLAFRAVEADETDAIESVTLSDLARADQLTPVFDLTRLRALAGGNYAIDCQLVEKSTGKTIGRFSQKFTKPALNGPKRFLAERADHSFAGVALDAVRVQFPSSAQFVFWRGANYMPWWEMNQLAMGPQGMEAWGGGGQGCSEAMQDRECRYSRVELIESSPARAVVHWRYALGDAHYRIHGNEWVDEYYVFYPDGAGVRQVKLWTTTNTRHQVFDTLMIKPPGARTAQLFEASFGTIAQLDGERMTMPAFGNDKARYGAFLQGSQDFIAEFLFKDRLHPFMVFSFRDDLMPGVTRGMVSINRMLFQNADQRGHWPLSRYPIDGHNAVGLDVPTHFSVGNIDTDVDPANTPNTWTFLIGAAEAGSEAPAAHARAWLYPAEVNVLDASATFRGYDCSQRGYRLAVSGGASRVTVRLNSSRGAVFHPVFLLEGAEAQPMRVKVDGKAVAAAQVAIARTSEGEAVIFLDREVESGATVSFEYE
jgi:hypothetical protein